MTTENESIQIWAEKQLVKFQPYDEWLAANSRTEKEKELYKKSFHHLLALAEGQEEHNGDLIIVSGDGKTVLFFDSAE